MIWNFFEGLVIIVACRPLCLVVSPSDLSHRDMCVCVCVLQQSKHETRFILKKKKNNNKTDTYYTVVRKILFSRA